MNSILKIDTTSTQESVLFWRGEKYVAANERFASQILLSLVDQAVEDLTAIEAIEVAAGPGSFTGLRVGFTVGQLLGWQLGCPVNGQPVSPQVIPLPEYEE